MPLQNFLLKKFYLASVIFIFNFPVAAQQFIREINTIPFSDSIGVLNNVFSGGLNNPEHQFIDIDNDSDLDLFLLDSDGTFLYFINIGTAENSVFTLSADSIPGLKFKGWFYFVDIDNDNDYDLFTGGIADLMEYRENTGTPENPVFILAEDTVRSASGNPIPSESGSNPVFADVDNDGDYDFITGNSVGTLTYYENTGSPQSFELTFITNEWQGLIIIGGPADNFRHGSSSLDFADIDGDSDLDLFWGDFFSPSLYFIQNIGDEFNPELELIYEIYPPGNDSIFTSGFNMPRLADIDADSDLDLFVSVLYDVTVPQGLMFWENTGTAFVPDFNSVTDDYLRTLDLRSSSVPAFVDIDNDNDPDMFAGNLIDPYGQLVFIENTGSSGLPEFIIKDESYIEQNTSISVAPFFGDIDNDMDFDLMIGNFDGKISLYKNNGSPELPIFIFEGLLQDSDNNIIDVGTFALPRLIDTDADGDLDLISGGFNGKIKYYSNEGDIYNYSFVEDTSYFSILDVGDNSSPFLFDIDGDGDYDLFSGSHTGNIFLFENKGDNTDPVWELLTDQFIGSGLGSDPVPVFIDIDDDTDYDLFIGNIKGGLFFFRNSELSDLSEENIPVPDKFELRAFPNPFNPVVNINFYMLSPEIVKVEVFNTLGEKIKVLFDDKSKTGLNTLTWDGTDFSGIPVSSGIYLVSVNDFHKRETIKISLIK